MRFWAQETYGDVRAWGVADAPRMTRARHLIEYVMHPLNLARAGGERTAAAEAFFRRAYLPLANAAWKWRSGFGFTDIDHLVMRHFLSEQVHAIRHDAGTSPPTARAAASASPGRRRTCRTSRTSPRRRQGSSSAWHRRSRTRTRRAAARRWAPAASPVTTTGARASSTEPRSTRRGRVLDVERLTDEVGQRRRGVARRRLASDQLASLNGPARPCARGGRTRGRRG